MLLLDDLFLIHEDAIPNYLGISEKLVFLAYGLITALYLVRFRKVILRTNYVIFAIAFMFLAASVFIDLLPGLSRWIPLPPMLLGENYLLEDGAKLFGITTWFFYFAHVGLRQVQQATQPQI